MDPPRLSAVAETGWPAHVPACCGRRRRPSGNTAECRSPSCAGREYGPTARRDMHGAAGPSTHHVITHELIERERELYDTACKQRHPRLERHGHARAVDLRQHEVRHERVEVEDLQAR